MKEDDKIIDKVSGLFMYFRAKEYTEEDAGIAMTYALSIMLALKSEKLLKFTCDTLKEETRCIKKVLENPAVQKDVIKRSEEATKVLKMFGY